ncbi:MAG: hypothetical protein APF81_18200 [Desulfosporosinus sp. BRH_c37]|nr:MAG: hypothetical protein APF81_18200 [Desulfosporosinus sp. BRH_c37]
MHDLVYQSNLNEEKYKLTNKQRKQLQHEIKIYVEKYFKSKLGNAADYCKVIIWNDLLVIRAEKLLTQVEKYIIQTQTQTPTGCDRVKEVRMQVAKQHSIDNLTYFEEKLGAKCIHLSYDVNPSEDFWVQVMVFDHVLIDL